jgi:uncharacterized coiled-coil protein SlyX
MKGGAPIALLASLLLLAACQGMGGSATSGSAKPTRDRTPSAGRRPAPAATAPNPRLEQRLARVELRLLEKEAQVEELQARLDDARREVVRSMAKLQSLATRAEAASGIAEAEIALQSLRAIPGAPGLSEAAQLMHLSSAEFDKENYAGALYLANQCKTAALAARGQVATSDRGTLRPGEVAFALPLKLQTTGRANVRDGPGSTFGIVATLQSGAPLTGHSYAEEWVRVTDDGGRRGWIYQGLVSRRR